MKHSFFDNIILGFLFSALAIFGILVFYSTYTTRKALIDDKIEVLTNEAFLIAEQTVSGYIQGNYDIDDVQRNIDYYSSTLNTSVWLADSMGRIYAVSNANANIKEPKNLYLLDQDFDITVSQSFTGDFFGVFSSDVISVAIPIQTDDEPNGMILLHSETAKLSEVQHDLVSAMYVPFMLMLILSILLLALISGKIIRPIRKLGSIAEQYAVGNFDVKTDIHSNDEIGQLALTIDYMASELSKLDEYRRDFISNISHDFRSPLTSIKGYIEAIKDGTIPLEKQDKYLDIVINETNRLTKLTSSLLELNKMDSYGIWLVMKEFDVIDLIKDALNTFEGKCQQKSISLILNNHCENTYVIADKTKIQQVIYNLLDNAIKFTPNGKNIYVTLTEKNDKLFISIKDEGCGIPADSINKIWVRFYKADVSRGKDKQGTGLGLAITREIVKAHGEHINVVSTVGVGSEFTFSLTKTKNNTHNEPEQ
jgi:signal transduction histidine kinase